MHLLPFPEWHCYWLVTWTILYATYNTQHLIGIVANRLPSSMKVEYNYSILGFVPEDMQKVGKLLLDWHIKYIP